VTFELDEAPDIYRGMNPQFVRQVWQKRRAQAPRPSQKWTPELKALVGEMMKAGKSSGEIARKFGVTSNSIAGLVHSSPELREIGFRTAYAEKMRERAKMGRTLRDAR